MTPFEQGYYEFMKLAFGSPVEGMKRMSKMMGAPSPGGIGKGLKRMSKMMGAPSPGGIGKGMKRLSKMMGAPG